MSPAVPRQRDIRCDGAPCGRLARAGDRSAPVCGAPRRPQGPLRRCAAPAPCMPGLRRSSGAVGPRDAPAPPRLRPRRSAWLPSPCRTTLGRRPAVCGRRAGVPGGARLGLPRVRRRVPRLPGTRNEVALEPCPVSATPSRTRPCVPLRPAVSPRTTTTGQCARAATPSDTEPSSRPASPPRPRAPVTSIAA